MVICIVNVSGITTVVFFQMRLKMIELEQKVTSLIETNFNGKYIKPCSYKQCPKKTQNLHKYSYLC